MKVYCVCKCVCVFCSVVAARSVAKKRRHQKQPAKWHCGSRVVMIIPSANVYAQYRSNMVHRTIGCSWRNGATLPPPLPPSRQARCEHRRRLTIGTPANRLRFRTSSCWRQADWAASDMVSFRPPHDRCRLEVAICENESPRLQSGQTGRKTGRGGTRAHDNGVSKIRKEREKESETNVFMQVGKKKMGEMTHM